MLDPTKPATELVGVLGMHNLTRLDFRTLGSNEELEARVSCYSNSVCFYVHFCLRRQLVLTHLFFVTDCQLLFGDDL